MIEKIKICSALINKNLYSDLNDLFKDTEKNIINNKLVPIEIPFDKVTYASEEKERQINRLAFIKSLINFINFFSKEKADIIEKRYSIKDSFFDLGELNNQLVIDPSERLVNYVKIIHNNDEVFWLSTDNAPEVINVSSSYVIKSRTSNIYSNKDYFIDIKDLEFMHSLDTLKDRFDYFYLLEDFIVDFVRKNKMAVDDWEYRLFLRNFFNAYDQDLSDKDLIDMFFKEMADRKDKLLTK